MQSTFVKKMVAPYSVRLQYITRRIFMKPNNYLITEQSVKEPPDSLGKMLKFLGPGFILSASIVGSGELIATTTLGAKAGFVVFWVIIVSCLVKVAVQLEFGKHPSPGDR